MRLATIGFTKKSAERFFSLLRNAGVTCLVDIRLHPGGQLAGFAKADDLPYFLRQLAACKYRHMASLAPTPELLNAYRQDHDWPRYAAGYADLLRVRDIPAALDEPFWRANTCCLLCSEATPDHCHRRLLAEAIAVRWPEVAIVHLL